MQKIKSFFKKYKDVFQRLLFVAWIFCVSTLLALVIIDCIQSYTKDQEAKHNQRLQQCMDLAPQNIVELCKILINR